MLMLQTEMDGASVTAIIAVFASVWRVRAACRRTGDGLSESALYDLVVKCLECPWLVRCVSSRDKRARRQDRIRPPRAAPERVIYRSDGASRGQGRDGLGSAGWGAAAWPASEEGYGEGPPVATVHGHLGDGISNNVAEYVGLRECMRRAVRLLHPHVVFQVDSKLVAEQMARHNAWACRSPELVPLRDACREFGHQLNHAAILWEVRHIYREFNQVADALANRGVDVRVAFDATASW